MKHLKDQLQYQEYEIVFVMLAMETEVSQQVATLVHQAVVDIQEIKVVIMELVLHLLVMVVDEDEVDEDEVEDEPLVIYLLTCGEVK